MIVPIISILFVLLHTSRVRLYVNNWCQLSIVNENFAVNLFLVNSVIIRGRLLSLLLLLLLRYAMQETFIRDNLRLRPCTHMELQNFFPAVNQNANITSSHGKAH